MGPPEHYREAMPITEQRIAARLHEALDHHVRADIFTLTAERGLAAGGPDAPSIRLTVEDVARIAAGVVDDIIDDNGRAVGGP